MTPVQRRRYRICFQMFCAPILFALSLAGPMSPAEKPEAPLPEVISASVPFYPPLARRARIEGVVHLQVSTDGSRVSAVSVESGHPMLAPVAEENVKTWQFREHSPTTFKATFRYQMLPESACVMDSGTVLLRLPAEVEVTAKGVRTCDPATVIEPDLRIPPPETVLGGLVLDRDTLETASIRHGDSYFSSDRDSYEIAWYDPQSSTYLRIKVAAGSAVVLIYLSRRGPTALKNSTLDNQHLSTGKGLRLGDSMSRVKELYGPTDKIDKHPEDAPPGSQQWWYTGWSQKPGEAPVLNTLVITFDKDKKVSEISLAYN